MRTVILLLIVAATWAWTDGMFSNPVPAKESEPPITVEASMLGLAYAANEVAANSAYSGRRLLVSGLVSDISQRRSGGTITLHLDRELNGGIGLEIELRDGQGEVASRLREGETIKVLCDNVGSPSLENCVIRDAGFPMSQLGEDMAASRPAVAR